MAKVTLTDGKQYWVLGLDFTVDQTVELDDKKDQELIEYVKALPNFKVEPTKKATLKKSEAPTE